MLGKLHFVPTNPSLAGAAYEKRGNIRRELIKERLGCIANQYLLEVRIL